MSRQPQLVREIETRKRIEETHTHERFFEQPRTRMDVGVHVLFGAVRGFVMFIVATTRYLVLPVVGFTTRFSLLMVADVAVFTTARVMLNLERAADKKWPWQLRILDEWSGGELPESIEVEARLLPAGESDDDN
jgi:hypothetical protein